MIKLLLADIEKVAAEKNCALYLDDLTAGSIRIVHDGQSYLLLAPETYEFFRVKYENFPWPNFTSDTAP
ncbi:hypothetical protein [Sphingorhabdus sp.]|uniref:hypothetical protein n=1 Tax=Sphingorhabdus sp. TaxID=1902408 RepID=UPI003340D876